jgi:hypothetical protein
MTIPSNKCNYHETLDAIDICSKCDARMCIGCKLYIEEDRILYPTCIVCSKKQDREEEDRKKLSRLRLPYVWLFCFNMLLVFGTYVLGIFSFLGRVNSYWAICLTLITVIYSIWLSLAYRGQWLGPTSLPTAND